MTVRRAVRTIVVLVIDALALMLLSEILPGFILDGALAALGVAAVVGLLNALVWPFLNRFALPLNVLTLGLGALVINGAFVLLATDVVPGAHLNDLLSGIVVTVGLTALTALASSLLAIDEDEWWHRNVVQRQARRRGEFVRSDVPGMIFLEIDGLAYDVLRRALRDGNAPTLASWVREGTHDLERWETDWSSQTGRLPGRAPPRQQPRHARFPLVGEGP